MSPYRLRPGIALLFLLGLSLQLVACGPPVPRHAEIDTRATRLVAQLPAASKGQPAQGLSYLRTALPGGVVVLYVHGTPGDAYGWLDYVLEPVPGTQSVALDRPGFGMSLPAGAVISLAAQAAAVRALMPTTGEKVVLVGHSLGGAVVARLAAERPQQVLSLVLLASSLDPAQEKIHPLQPLGQMWPVRSMLPRALRNANDELMNFKRELYLLEPLLAQVRAPTIIVHGTQDDLVPFANVAYMESHLTGAQCVKTRALEGVNHFLPWNSEPVVRDAIAWAAQPVCSPT